MDDDKFDDANLRAKLLERQESLISHTDDDAIADLLTQRQTPEEWLEALTKLDFADPASVLNLRFDLVKHHVGEFILCTGKDAFTVSPCPGALTLEETPIVDHDSVHPGLLALELFPKSKARPAPADEKPPNHHFLLGVSDSDETEYVLVVDAITPGHPVWLIWDRLSGHEPEPDYVHPDERDPVFHGVGKNFDAAQILPTINDWLESYGNLNFNQVEESIKATGLLGFVKAKEVTLAYVTELLGQAESQLATDTMENDEMSDADVAEIKAALGSPFQGKNCWLISPSEYLRKLEGATARDSSLDRHPRKAWSIPPRRSPLEWLQKLAITDFADRKALLSLDCGLLYITARFDLVTSDEAIYAMRACSDILDNQDQQKLVPENHFMFLTLEVSTLPGTEHSLPTLVYTVGEVTKKVKSTTYDSSTESTEYVLVVDIIAPRHPVWLIYNRNQDVECGEERCIVDPAHMPLIFESIGYNFDAAQIFPSIHDWVQSYGNVDFGKFEESIKATCITGAVEAKAILSSEVDVLLRQ
ncbi:uncharacterized protein FMAN_03566 [Fusarium mangiferae]|uniref:Uncharacterized protein n=1 Tax=Fusarium mangiferae TaxID=192010 RepID=A0A1L7T966_FUSMA|nr:uncharacterized protein FMAN_03566 [Fusarium mangiferae]CVK94479.1 uncharacterized protein FMAN_03566 [Fusarium mangiferae]